MRCAGLGCPRGSARSSSARPVERGRQVTTVLWSDIVHEDGVQGGLEQAARLNYRGGRPERDQPLRLRAWAGYGPVVVPVDPLMVLLEAGSDEGGWRGLVDFGALAGDPLVAEATLRA